MHQYISVVYLYGVHQIRLVFNMGEISKIVDASSMIITHVPQYDD